MLKHLMMIVALLSTPLRAEETPQDTYNSIVRAIQSVDSEFQAESSKDCLNLDPIAAAARERLSQLESYIFNAMQHPAWTKNFIGPYLRLWVLGKLGSDFFDLMLPNPGIEETYEIEKNIYLTGVYTRKENGKIYWVPLLVDIGSRTITLLTWEQCRGKCYTQESAYSTQHGICGRWLWEKETQEVVSFCSCHDRRDCGAKNTYVIRAGNLALKKSLRKRKCDGKSFEEYAKPCCAQ